MSDRVAPIAMRMPISRVRSVTETSMMFMMPMPPTSSEIAAMPTSSSVSVVENCCAVCTNCVELRTWKSSWELSVMLCRCSSSVVIAVCAPVHVVRVIDLREDLVDILRDVQARLGDGEGDIDHVVLVSQSAGPLGLQHADDAERLAANGNHLPQWLSRRGGEKVIHYGLPDHRNRRSGRVVGVAEPLRPGPYPSSESAAWLA